MLRLILDFRIGLKRHGESAAVKEVREFREVKEGAAIKEVKEFREFKEGADILSLNSLILPRDCYVGQSPPRNDAPPTCVSG